MERGERRESELERELDGLYRKVAGLDQTDEERQGPIRTRSGPAGKGPAAVGQRVPERRKKRRRFRTAGLGLGLAVVLAILGVLVFLGEWRSPPVNTGVIELTAEETKDHPATPPPAAASVKGRGEPPAVDPPPVRRERYAVQIRAYPEDQRQKALTFLEDVRKRTPHVSLESVSIAGRGVWHRILLGDFPTAEEAAEYQKHDSVAREHPYGFIQRKYRSDPLAVPAPGSAAGAPPPPSRNPDS